MYIHRITLKCVVDTNNYTDSFWPTINAYTADDNYVDGVHECNTWNESSSAYLDLCI